MLVAIIKRLHADRRGATAIEYGLIVALVVIATVGAIVQLADKTTGMWNHVSTSVTAVPVQ